jgi:hypothetical protein
MQYSKNDRRPQQRAGSASMGHSVAPSAASEIAKSFFQRDFYLADSLFLKQLTLLFATSTAVGQRTLTTDGRRMRS